MLTYFNFKSSTSYVWLHHVAPKSFPTDDYSNMGDAYLNFTNKYLKTTPLPYYPNVTVGWDASPRCVADTFKPKDYPCMAVVKNNTPALFEKYLKATRQLILDQKMAPIITINSWNEWTEGSCLEPEKQYGFGYLEAIKKVFSEK